MSSNVWNDLLDDQDLDIEDSLFSGEPSDQDRTSPGLLGVGAGVVVLVLAVGWCAGVSEEEEGLRLWAASPTGWLFHSRPRTGGDMRFAHDRLARRAARPRTGAAKAATGKNRLLL